MPVPAMPWRTPPSPCHPIHQYGFIKNERTRIFFHVSDSDAASGGAALNDYVGFVIGRDAGSGRTVACRVETLTPGFDPSQPRAGGAREAPARGPAPRPPQARPAAPRAGDARGPPLPAAEGPPAAAFLLLGEELLPGARVGMAPPGTRLSTGGGRGRAGPWVRGGLRGGRRGLCPGQAAQRAPSGCWKRLTPAHPTLSHAGTQRGVVAVRSRSQASVRLDDGVILYSEPGQDPSAQHQAHYGNFRVQGELGRAIILLRGALHGNPGA